MVDCTLRLLVRSDGFRVVHPRTVGAVRGCLLAAVGWALDLVLRLPAGTNSSGLSGNLQCSNGNFKLQLFRRYNSKLMSDITVNLYSKIAICNRSRSKPFPYLCWVLSPVFMQVFHRLRLTMPKKRIDLNEHLIRNKEATFLFRVRGDSMTGIGIYEGDTLLVDRSIDPRHNAIVLAVLNNEFTVKRLYRRGGVMCLLRET